MEKHTLKAEERKIFGRKVKRLRSEGSLPANIYGKKVKSQAVVVETKDFLKVYGIVGETGLVDLTIGKANKPILIHNVQKDPMTDLPIHVDFMQVDLKQKVVAQVPVEIIGSSPAEKQGLGTVVVQLNEIEVEALPTDLPEKFEVDVSSLEDVDQAILVKDLKVEASKVEIKNNLEDIVVKVEALKEEKEEEKPVEAPVEEEAGEATGPLEEEKPQEQPTPTE